MRMNGIEYFAFALALFLLAAVPLSATPISHAEESSLKAGGYHISFIEQSGALRIAGEHGNVDVFLTESGLIQPVEDIVFQHENQTDDRSRSVLLQSDEAEGTLFFRNDGIIEFKSDTACGIYLISDIHYGIVPGFFLEDLQYNMKKKNESNIHLPSANIVIGLIAGNNSILTATWPEGNQKIELHGKTDCDRQGISVKTDKQPLYFALLCSPAIWHCVKIKEEYHNQDVELEWENPFEADWKSELYEVDTVTSFFFRSGKSERWRPGIGRYVWPVWFDGDSAFLRIGRRIKPVNDEVVIYPLRGHRLTPVQFMLDSSCATARIVEDIYERRDYIPYGRHGKKGGPWVGFDRCGGTALLDKMVYRSGMQEREKLFLADHIRSLTRSIICEQTRHMEYHAFSEHLESMIYRWKADEYDNKKVVDFLESMLELVEIIERNYKSGIETGGRKNPVEHMTYILELEKRVLSLLEEIPDGNLEYYNEFSHILSLYRRQWSQHESMGWRFGQDTRRLYKAAGYQSAGIPQAIMYAEIIRAEIMEELKCRQFEIP